MSLRQSESSHSLLTQTLQFKWRFLTHLGLADNGLTHIATDALAPVSSTLQSLDLSSNLFTEIPDCLSSLTSLKALNMSNCMIDSLRSLSERPLSKITVLNLNTNRISSLVGIEGLKTLQRLDVRDNRMKDPVEAVRLTGMPKFFEVHVSGNPFAKLHPSYRLTIFNLFRAVPGFVDDITIDTLGPSYGERRHLAERTADTLQAPVVRPQFKDESRVENSDRAGQSDSRGTLQDSEDTVTTTRWSAKKTHVTEMAEPQTTTSTTTLDSTTTAREPSPTRQQPTARANASPESAAKRETPASRKLSETLGQSSEAYRTRIEALKLERGNAWLTAIESIGTGNAGERVLLEQQRATTIAAGLEG